MATTREQIDSRGRNILQLLMENESALHNVMNPSSRDQDTYDGPGDETVNISWPMGASTVGSTVADSVKYFLKPTHSFAIHFLCKVKMIGFV